MARPYSDDLRQKLLEAHDQGKGTLAELADRFSGSLAWAWKISSARKRTGSTERTPYQTRPKVRVDREPVRRFLEAKPDLYLRELQAELKASTGMQVSTPHLWKIDGELGFRLKKVAPRHRARHGSEPAAAPSLRRTTAFDRLGTVGLPRRKRRFHADDQALRTGSSRPSHRRSDTRRQLEAPHHPGRDDCARHDRHHDRRGRDRRGDLPRLSRSRALPPTPARPGGGHGQPQFAQGSQSPDRRRGSIVTLPAAPTRPTSIPSRKPGPSSNSNSAPPRHEPQPHSNKPPQNSSPPSAHKTQPLGSGCLCILYINN